MKSKGIWRALTSGFVLLLAAALLFYLYPIQIIESYFQLDMKLHGVSVVHLNKLEAFEKNECRISEPCQCVLLIHGLGDRAITWRAVLKEPPVKNRRWLAINLPGSGSTPPRPLASDYQIKNLARYTWKSLVDEDCSTWTLVGNSLGGWLVLEMAKHPKVTHLIVEPAAGVKSDYREVVNVYKAPTSKKLKTLADMAYYNSRTWIPDFVFRALAERLRKMPVKKYLKAQKMNGFLGEELKDLKKPALILWGSADEVLPVTLGRRLDVLLPNSEFHVLKKCGHLPHKECNQDFNRYVSRFLNR